MTVPEAVVIAAIAAIGAGIGLVYRDLQRQLDWYRNALWRTQGHADRAVKLADKVVPEDPSDGA